MHRCHGFTALVLLLLASLAAPPAEAQIKRCVSADGGHVYTDRACKDVGATERLPRAAPGQATETRAAHRDCSRSVQDLVFEMTTAIDNRDVNRLAGLYHWPGASTRGAQAIMGRLDTIVNRPLIDITALQPPPAPAPAAAAPAWQSAPAALLPRPPAAPEQAPVADDGDGTDSPGLVHAALLQPPQARRAPTGLVVDQTIADRITPAQTVFSLRRHLDCWWISL